MLLCSTFLMFTCFDDRMLPSPYALLITCDLPVCHISHLIGRFDDYLIKYSNALMIASSLASMFTCLISTHECTHDDREMSIVLEAQVIVLSDVRALKYFDDCACIPRRLGDYRYVYLGA